MCIDVERVGVFSMCLAVLYGSFEFILGSCVFTLSLCCYPAHDELKMVSNQHIMNK